MEGNARGAYFNNRTQESGLLRAFKWRVEVCFNIFSLRRAPTRWSSGVLVSNQCSISIAIRRPCEEVELLSFASEVLRSAYVNSLLPLGLLEG